MSIATKAAELARLLEQAGNDIAAGMNNPAFGNQFLSRAVDSLGTFCRQAAGTGGRQPGTTPARPPQPDLKAQFHEWAAGIRRAATSGNETVCQNTLAAVLPFAQALLAELRKRWPGATP